MSPSERAEIEPRELWVNVYQYGPPSCHLDQDDADQHAELSEFDRTECVLFKEVKTIKEKNL